MIKIHPMLIAILLLGVPMVPSNAFAGGMDMVAGAGRFDFLAAKVEIFAKCPRLGCEMDTGKNATGRFRLRQEFGGIFVHGEVMCLRVYGNIAVAGGMITNSDEPYDMGKAFYQWTRDEADFGEENDDASETVLPEVMFDGTCPDPRYPPPDLMLIDSDRGNYIVKDRQ